MRRVFQAQMKQLKKHLNQLMQTCYRLLYHQQDSVQEEVGGPLARGRGGGGEEGGGVPPAGQRTGGGGWSPGVRDGWERGEGGGGGGVWGSTSRAVYKRWVVPWVGGGLGEGWHTTSKTANKRRWVVPWGRGSVGVRGGGEEEGWVPLPFL